jgi:hypothetical protein
MSEKQKQVAGDYSLNLQSGEIRVGLSYADARQVASDVFEANFYRLSTTASEVARSRADELIVKYLHELKRSSYRKPALLDEIANPDMQYSIFTAQRDFARSGDRELGDMLVTLLVERTCVSERTLLQIALGEALAVVSRLTIDQMNALSIVFSLRYTVWPNLESVREIGEYFEELWSQFGGSLPTREFSYRHLEFAACASIDITRIDLHTLLRRRYPGLFSRGLSRTQVVSLFGSGDPPHELFGPTVHKWDWVQVAGTNKEIRKRCQAIGLSSELINKVVKLLDTRDLRQAVIDAVPAAKPLFELWDGTLMCHLQLTSVGMAIACANIQRRTGRQSEVSNWL